MTTSRIGAAIVWSTLWGTKTILRGFSEVLPCNPLSNVRFSGPAILTGIDDLIMISQCNRADGIRNPIIKDRNASKQMILGL